MGWHFSDDLFTLHILFNKKREIIIFLGGHLNSIILLLETHVAKVQLGEFCGRGKTESGKVQNEQESYEAKAFFIVDGVQAGLELLFQYHIFALQLGQSRLGQF